MRQLILGGVRSGKSRLAEKMAADSGLPVCYVATAMAGDAEMAARIAAHRARRPAGWCTVEAGAALGAVLRQEDAPGRVLLVDCLTLWLSNLLGANDDALPGREMDALLATLPSLRGDVIMIANETGLGVMPANALARRFCDEAGRLNQRLGALCDRVTFVAAGLPLVLKGPALD